jgi:hypothetical protein
MRIGGSRFVLRLCGDSEPWRLADFTLTAHNLQARRDLLQPAAYGCDPSGFVAVGDAFAATAGNVSGAGGQGDGKGLTPTTTFCENPPTETLK